jgi:hypothetical protein
MSVVAVKPAMLASAKPQLKCPVDFCSVDLLRVDAFLQELPRTPKNATQADAAFADVAIAAVAVAPMENFRNLLTPRVPRTLMAERSHIPTQPWGNNLNPASHHNTRIRITRRVARETSCVTTHLRSATKIF